MFEQSLLEMAQMGSTKKPYTVLISAIFQCFLVGLLILIPLIYTEALPTQDLMTFLVAPPPPPPPPPADIAEILKKIIPKEFDAGRLLAPKEIPEEIAIIDEPPETAVASIVGGVPGGVPGGMPGGVIGGIISSTPLVAPPPPPPKPVTPKRIRVGGNVQKARLIRQPKPMYPPLARQARIQGTVRLEAIIAKDGTIQQLRVVTGHPLLVQAALSAVRRWRYQATVLNGVPVEVATTIDVHFTLR